MNEIETKIADGSSQFREIIIGDYYTKRNLAVKTIINEYNYILNDYVSQSDDPNHFTNDNVYVTIYDQSVIKLLHDHLELIKPFSKYPKLHKTYGGKSRRRSKSKTKSKK